MRKVLAIGVVVVAASVAGAAPDKKEMSERIQNAAIVLDEIHKAPDSDIPNDLGPRPSASVCCPRSRKALSSSAASMARAS